MVAAMSYVNVAYLQFDVGIHALVKRLPHDIETVFMACISQFRLQKKKQHDREIAKQEHEDKKITHCVMTHQEALRR